MTVLEELIISQFEECRILEDIWVISIHYDLPPVLLTLSTRSLFHLHVIIFLLLIILPVSPISSPHNMRSQPGWIIYTLFKYNKIKYKKKKKNHHIKFGQDKRKIKETQREGTSIRDTVDIFRSPVKLPTWKL